MKLTEFLDQTIIYFLMTCFTVVLMYFIIWKLSRLHLYNLAASVPLVEGRRMLPFIGHAAYFLGDLEHFITSIRLICGTIKPPRVIWVCYKLFFLINRVEDIEVVLNSNKCLSKDDSYQLSVPLIGSGLMSMPPSEWKRHRKLISPTFNHRILNKFVEVFSNQAEIFVKLLENKTGQLINIFDYTSKLALDIVCETAMGVRINAQSTDSKIEYAIQRGMENIMIRGITIPYHADWIYKFTELYREDKKNIDIFCTFVNGIIEKKLTEYRNNVKMNLEEKENVAFLELLIQLSETSEQWTFEELRAEVSVFIIAGSDPSATVSSFVMVMLGMHPEIQQKCYAEVMEILGTDRHLEYTDLPKFIYLEKVIKETMRLFPVGPLILRKIDEDLEVGKYTLPRGGGLLINILAIHYSELYYNDPWKFDPERFSLEEIAKRHKYAYIPFSAGPRNCIGSKYGMMAIKTILAVTLRKYRIETTYKQVSDIRIKQSVVISTVDGFPLRLFLREQS